MCLYVLFSVLCCPIMCLYVLYSVLWCSLQFPHKTMVFVSSFLWEGSGLIYVICACLRVVVSNTCCVVFLICFSSSCVAYVASFSVFFFVLCGLCCQFLCVFLRLVWPMLPVSLGCPFLITHSVFSNVYYGHKLLRRDQKSDEVYSIQYYVIKFLRDLRQVGGFLQVLMFPPPIKLTSTI
jgi:hypothetical protein